MIKAFKAKDVFDLEARFGSTVQITESQLMQLNLVPGYGKTQSARAVTPVHVLQIAMG
jgi:hypothetical protein